VIGGFLTQYLGWRSIFAFLAPFGLASLALVKMKIKAEWADSQTEEFDKTGSLLYAVSLFSIIYGFSKLHSVTGWIFYLPDLWFQHCFFCMRKEQIIRFLIFA
jgi:predicted MFS family arabinose efflux permease